VSCGSNKEGSHTGTNDGGRRRKAPRTDATRKGIRIVPEASACYDLKNRGRELRRKKILFLSGRESHERELVNAANISRAEEGRDNDKGE